MQHAAVMLFISKSNVCENLFSILSKYKLHTIYLHAISLTDSHLLQAQFNSWWPSNAYMRQYTTLPLNQIMTCRLFRAKSLSKPVLPQLETHSNTFQWNWNQHATSLIQLNESENAVCKIVVILSGPQCIDPFVAKIVRMNVNDRYASGW